MITNQRRDIDSFITPKLLNIINTLCEVYYPGSLLNNWKHMGTYTVLIDAHGLLLLTWFDFNPSMDK